jgi:YebC/PmpR family DNA-binding regulatory protein
MSGHSKWSTIKHKKAINDNRRGQQFTKLARVITIASGESGPDPETNFKLRLAIDKARQFNMPNSNIERAVERGTGKVDGEILHEVIYEGYGPEKVAILIEAVTDNKNRTVAEIKNYLEKSGGVLGQSGSVMYLFDKKGILGIKIESELEEQMLKIMDLGVEEVEVEGELIVVLTAPNLLMEAREKIAKLGYVIESAELSYKAKSYLSLEKVKREKLDVFFDNLDEMDDVSNIYSNLEEVDDKKN